VQVFEEVAGDPDRVAEEGDREVVHMGLHHRQGEQAARSQQVVDRAQGERNLRARQHQQGEERGDTVETAQVTGATGAQVGEVQLVERGGGDVLAGQLHHAAGQVHTHDLKAGVRQLPGGRDARATAEVQHAGARIEGLDQPVTGSDLALLVREGLVVPVPDGIEGLGLT
jgi:hypothetical protein